VTVTPACVVPLEMYCGLIFDGFGVGTVMWNLTLSTPRVTPGATLEPPWPHEAIASATPTAATETEKARARVDGRIAA
jgi:hypothetical protein